METEVQEKIICRYLLGDLPEAEQLALVQEFFTDEEKFEQVWAIENELVDRYVRGGLSAVEKNLFEKNYLASPAHRQRLAFAETLVQAADSPIERRTADYENQPSVSRQTALLRSFRGNVVRWSGVAAMLIVVAGGIWLFTQSARLREHLNQLNNESAVEQQRLQQLEKEIADARQQSDNLAVELERLRQEQAKPPDQPPIAGSPNPVDRQSVVSLLLSPMIMRSGSDTQQLKLSKETTEVLLQIKIQEADGRNFLVSLRTVEGAQVWSGRAVNRRAPEKKGSILALRLPANKLSANDYILTLSANQGTKEPQETDRYFFRVIKQ